MRAAVDHEMLRTGNRIGMSSDTTFFQHHGVYFRCLALQISDRLELDRFIRAPGDPQHDYSMWHIFAHVWSSILWNKSSSLSCTMTVVPCYKPCRHSREIDYLSTEGFEIFVLCKVRWFSVLSKLRCMHLRHQSTVQLLHPVDRWSQRWTAMQGNETYGLKYTIEW